MRKMPIKHPKCRFDYNGKVTRQSISEEWLLNMLMYAIYLWSDGDGSYIRTYSLPQAKAVYASIKKDFETKDVRFVMPSPLELVSMAQSNHDSVAFEVIEYLTLEDEALGLLAAEYVSWKIAVEKARKEGPK